MYIYIYISWYIYIYTYISYHIISHHIISMDLVVSHMSKDPANLSAAHFKSSWARPAPTVPAKSASGSGSGCWAYSKRWGFQLRQKNERFTPSLRWKKRCKFRVICEIYGDLSLNDLNEWIILRMKVGLNAMMNKHRKWGDATDSPMVRRLPLMLFRCPKNLFGDDSWWPPGASSRNTRQKLK